MADGKVFLADYAKRVANCKRCKTKLEKGSLRVAKLTSNYFAGDDDGSLMKSYFHPVCIFESFLKAKATTKIIEEEEDIDCFGDLEDEDKKTISKLIKETLEKRAQSPSKKKKLVQAQLDLKKTGGSPIKKPRKKQEPSRSITPPLPLDPDIPIGRCDNFREYRKLCAGIAEVSGYLAKTEVVKNFIQKDKFDGDLFLLFKLLLPGVVKRVYNLNNKQLVKLFSQIFQTNLDEMVNDLEKGDVADTIQVFFKKSSKLKPVKKSTLTNQELDNMLENLSTRTKEDEQLSCLKNIASKCTYNDLKMVIRLIKHDLRINAGAKHILDALDPNAYEAFKASHNLKDVVDRVIKRRSGELVKELSIKACLMTPVKPMLAEACKSIESAMAKCPNGMFAEIKYDGERVQLHKSGDKFCYFSRSLKPVQAHKVSHFKEFIPKAFPGISDLILDCEVLLIDNKTSKPLPFGTLGVHKKAAFKDANVCLFIFDCLLCKGENLMDRPLKERRALLEDSMIEIPNRILFSENHKIKKAADLRSLLTRVFNEKLEGLVLKDAKSIYEPGKRHWLKVKKDYLASGAMADTADLVVLGAYFGTGTKGGLMSIFLMGVYDSDEKKWVTVTKCGSGFDDKTLDKLQSELDVIKISQDKGKVPSWLKVSNGYVPDFVVRDPKNAPVWEVTGTEFSKSEAHTADGISIRFPRCTKRRDDKSWEEATSLQQLKVLFEESKKNTDIVIPGAEAEDSEDEDTIDDNSDGESAPKRRKLDDSVKSKKEANGSGDTESGTYFGPKNKLPDYFKDATFFIKKELENYKQLKRYIIAFGGLLVKDTDKDSADYVISDENSDNKKYRTEEWLHKCINKIMKWKIFVPVFEILSFIPLTFQWSILMTFLRAQSDVPRNMWTFELNVCAYNSRNATTAVGCFKRLKSNEFELATGDLVEGLFLERAQYLFELPGYYPSSHVVYLELSVTLKYPSDYKYFFGHFPVKLKKKTDNNKYNVICKDNKFMINVTFQYQVDCKQKYYNSDCSKYCNSEGKPQYICDNTGKLICTQGWTGKFCNIKDKSAKESDNSTCLNCLHGGSCEMVQDKPICICPTGYTGIYCEDIEDFKLPFDKDDDDELLTDSTDSVEIGQNPRRAIKGKKPLFVVISVVVAVTLLATIIVIVAIAYLKTRDKNLGLSSPNMSNVQNFPQYSSVNMNKGPSYRSNFGGSPSNNKQNQLSKSVLGISSNQKEMVYYDY